MMPATATVRFDHVVKVILAVVVAQLLSRFDLASGVDEHALAIEDCFAVRLTRVIDTAGEIFFHIAVDREVGINDVEEILAAFLIRRFITDQRAIVFDHKIFAFDLLLSKQSEAGIAALYLEGVLGRSGISVRHAMQNEWKRSIKTNAFL